MDAPDSFRTDPATVSTAVFTEFIGREQEVPELCCLLRHAHTRLVTLTGPGGVGKTRLALEVASRLCGSFADGTIFVPLALVEDPGMVTDAIAQAVGLPQASGSAVEGVKSYLRSREILLVLDNFEQVLEAGLLVSDLLVQATGLKVLTTSREPLHLYGEHEFSVPPLSLPCGEELVTASGLEKYDAVRLFVQRAQAVQREFVPTDEDLVAIAEICCRLDCLPLAIELAAARTKTLPPKVMTGMMEHSLPLLTSATRDRPQRHRTLHAAIEWSYNLLTDGEKALFRRMAVFAGGCTFDAAEAVIQAGAAEKEQGADSTASLEDRLEALVEKSLLQQHMRAGDRGIYMLFTMREYALEQMEASCESDALRGKHAAYYLALAEEGAPHLQGPRQIHWLQQLDAEQDNLRAALRFYGEQGKVVEQLRLGGALAWFWCLRGLYQEGRTCLESALASFEKAPKGKTAGAARAEASARWGAGILCIEQGDYAAAERYLSSSESLYQHLNDKPCMARAAVFRAMACHKQGRTAQGKALLDQTAELCRGIEGQWDLALSLLYRGITADEEGDYAKVQQVCGESLEIFRELGDGWGTALSLACLGNIVYRQRRFALAQPYYEESARLLESLGAKAAVSWVYASLGHTHMLQGDNEKAAAFYRKGLPLYRELDNPLSLAWTMNGMGEVERARGEYGRAEQFYRESLPIFQRINEGRGVGWALHNLGVIAYHQGNYTQAGSCYREAITFFAEVDFKLGIAACLMGMAGVAAKGGEVGKAARLFGAGDALLERHNMELEPVDREEYGPIREAARSLAGEGTWQSEWTSGRRLSLRETLRYVGVEPPPTARPAEDAEGAPQHPGEDPGLTEREMEVLVQLACGLTNKEIGDELQVSHRTINAHLRSIFCKLEVTTRSAATRLAVEKGLV